MKERKLNRKKGYDYCSNGWYFITCVVKGRENWFGKIVNNKVKLNKYGHIVRECWFDLPKYFSNCVLDDHIIMPNHFHGIIQIDNDKSGGAGHNFVRTGHGLVRTGCDLVGTGLRPVPTLHNRTNINKKIHSLSQIVGSFKSFSSRQINQNSDELNKIFRWQRSFHDIIIKNEKQYNTLVKYIHENPINFFNL
ncbi:transposase [Candidatus Dojkabacteria bacterium]|uniref:Transposase n=1 Tax=Candidatus Dojkabacteria bacterium TaxID=2099670 RepID=A0A955L2V3_9BACT|nr:transposase [Candidatus Dojkabacteria bacterium]